MVCYSLRSPDGKQQRVFENPKVALEWLAKCPVGWMIEEFFDGWISRGVFAMRTDDNDNVLNLQQAISIFGKLGVSTVTRTASQNKVVRLVLGNIAEQARQYSLRQAGKCANN